MSKKNNSNNKSAAAAAAAAASGRAANDAPPPVAQSNPSTHDVLSTLFNLVGANNHARNNHLTATLPAYAYHSGWLGAPTAARRTFGAFLVFYRALHDHVRNVGPAHTQTLEALANELWNVTINAVPAGGGRELFSARCAALTPEARLTIAVLPVAGAAVSTARPGPAFVQELMDMYGLPPVSHTLIPLDLSVVGGSLHGTIRTMRLINELFETSELLVPRDAFAVLLEKCNMSNPLVPAGLTALESQVTTATDNDAAWIVLEKFATGPGSAVMYWSTSASTPTVHALAAPPAASAAGAAPHTPLPCRFCVGQSHRYRHCPRVQAARQRGGVTTTGGCAACGSTAHRVADCAAMQTPPPPATPPPSAASAPLPATASMNTKTGPYAFSPSFSSLPPPASLGAVDATSLVSEHVALNTDITLSIDSRSVPCRATLDTGANASAIDLSYALSLGLVITQSPLAVIVPGGAQIPSAGWTHMDVSLGDTRIAVTALVIADLGHPVLLGTRHLLGGPHQLETRGCGSTVEIEVRLGSTGRYVRARFAHPSAIASTTSASPPAASDIVVGALSADADHEMLLMLIDVAGEPRLVEITAPTLVLGDGSIALSSEVLDALDGLAFTSRADSESQRTCLTAALSALVLPPTLDDDDPLGAGEVDAQPPARDDLPPDTPDFLRVHVSPGATDDVALALAARLRAAAHIYGGSAPAPPVSHCPPFALRLLPHADLTQLRSRDRPFGPEAAAAIEAQLKQWQPDVIEPSNAPYSSRPLAVRKRDGSWRICVDYRRVNKACHLLQYPLARLPDVLGRLARHGVLFSKCDGWAMFNTLSIDDEATRDLTSFKALGRLWRFKRCPFGLSSLPSHLQRFMDQVYHDVRYAPYADDLNVAHASAAPADALADIDDMHARTDAAAITFKASKCYFLYRELDTLGHRVSHGHISPPHDRLDGLLALPRPDAPAPLRKFLHVAQQLSPHIPLFSRHAARLYALANSPATSIDWSAHADASAGLDALLDALRSPAILAPFDANRPVLLRTDFSHLAVSWVVLQLDDSGVERIVHCGGARLESYASAWPPQLGELYALRLAARKCPQYLTCLPQPFTWLCDNKPMTDTSSTPPDRPSNNPMIERILLEMQAVPFVAVHVGGTSPAQSLQDYLSRLSTFPSTPPPAAAAADTPPPGAAHTAADTMLARRLVLMPRFASASNPLAAAVAWLRALPAHGRALDAFPQIVAHAPVATSAPVATAPALVTPSSTSPPLLSLAPLASSPAPVPAAPPSSPRGMPGAPPPPLVIPLPAATVALPAPPAAVDQLAGGAALLHAVDPLATLDAAMRDDAWRKSLRTARDAHTRLLLRAADADTRSRVDAPAAFWDGRGLLRVPRAADRSSAIAAGTPLDRTQCLVYVPSERRLEVFAAYHHGDLGGHYGADTTRRLIMCTFAWRGITADVARWCGECHRCVVSRHHRAHGGSGLPDATAHAAAAAKFRCVAVDLIDLPLTADGYTYALIAVDLCTRMVACAPLKDKTAAGAAEAFRRCWLLVYGVPWVVLTDNGTEFIGPEWAAMSQQYGFTRSHSAPHNPQGNSIAERAVQEVKNRLARVSEAVDGADWVAHLARALAAVNNVIGSRGYSAFELCFGQPMLTPAAARLGADSFVIRGSPAEVAVATAERASQLVAVVAARRAAHQLNDAVRRRASAPTAHLDVGDVVGWNTRDNDASKFARLSRKYPGPFIIVAKAPYSSDGYAAFQLARPDGSHITDRYIPARQLALWRGDPWLPTPAAIAAEPGAQPWQGIGDRSRLDRPLARDAVAHDARLAAAADHETDVLARITAAEERVLADLRADRDRDARAVAAAHVDALITDATTLAIDVSLTHNTPLPARGIRIYDTTLPSLPIVDVLAERLHSTSQVALAIVLLSDDSRAIVHRDLIPVDLLPTRSRPRRSTRRG